MRLTLRAMLAYLDDMLEPADRQDIGQKIEESEFATGLVHRVRDVSRRMRLAAPKVSGRGMGLDPNTVAEYLDHTLAAERVPDFERVCLESDVHLAEVACCHQVLALVQVQPAEIDPELRQKMYELGAHADEESTERTAEKTGAAAALATAADGRSHRVEPPELPRRRPEVPEYLRSGSKSQFKPVAITLVLTACLLAAIFLAAGSPERLWNLVTGKGGPETAQNGPAKDGTQPALSATSSTSAGQRASNNASAPGANTAGPRLDAAVRPATGNNAGEPSKSGLVAPVTEHTAPPPPNPTDDKRAAVPPPPPEEATRPAIEPQPPSRPNVVPDVANEKPSVPAATNEKPADPAATNEKPLIPAAAGDASAKPVDPAGQGGQRIGLLIPDKEQVLLRLPADSGEWHRSDPGMAVNLGDKLLALPTFQPTVTLATGVTLQLVPETLVELAGIEQGIPVVRLHFGRVILMTTGNAGVKVKLALGDFAGTLVFDDAEAKIGAEVRPYHLPGVDPEKNQPQRAVSLYGINGDASWVAAGGNTEKLHAPARLVLAVDAVQSNPEREMPKWAITDTPSPLDVRAAKDLNKALDDKRPVTQALLELASHRRAENKSMAARALALIDEFGPFDNLFNDPDEKAVWPIQIESLKAALARGPAVAGKVRAALQSERGKDGDELYRMLWGYSKEEVAAGAAAKLIDYLDHDSMDMRVLAFYNLRQIVGASGPESYYRPEQPAAVRQQSIRRWRERFKEGLLGAKPSATKPAAGEGPDKAAPEALPRRSTEGAAPLAVPPAPDAGPK